MGFLSGLVTGAAQSIDAQLKKDIERSQERAEGMAQYRVTRRRAEIERQEKEKREIADVMNNLASLVDGDIDKAAQLYVSGGKNVAGATSLYNELKKNADAGKDISTALTFAESRAEPGQLTDYVSQFVTPIAALPVMEGEMKASGLYGALFKPDMSKQVMREVEEAAPLPEAPDVAMDITGAQIDRTGLMAAEEYKETQRTRERAEGTYGMSVARHETAQAQATQSMEIAAKAEARAERLANEGAAQQKVENARADAAAAREQARLDLATAAAEREAALQAGKVELQGLTIETRQKELEKMRNAPKFSTFELMIVNAEQKLAEQSTLPPEMQDRRLIQELEAQRDYALNGIQAVAQAGETTGYTASFSKQSIDSIINSEIKRQLQPVGLVRDIEGELKFKIKGNEVQYFDRMTRAFDNVAVRTRGIDDAQMTNALTAQRQSLRSDVSSYIKKQQEKGVTFKSAPNAEEAVKGSFTAQLKAGDIVSYKSASGATINRIWTGSRYV